MESNNFDVMLKEEEYIKKTLNIKDSRFIGPMPVSLERKHLNSLYKYTYYVTEKSDGVRYLLYCFEMDNTNYSVFIDRKMKMTLCNITFKNVVYDNGGSLFDGERIGNTFIVFDCYRYNGKDLKSSKFTERITHAQYAKDEYIKTGLSFVVKKFYNLTDFDKLVNEKSPETDGIIFVPNEIPVFPGTNWSLFKWKTNHTVDFIINNDYELFSLDKGNLIKTGQITQFTDETQDFLDNLFGDNIFDETDDTFLIEAEFKNGNWVPIKERKDKTHPNNTFTLERTLVNIKENITEQELLVHALNQK